jgi:hypothetical protein
LEEGFFHESSQGRVEGSLWSSCLMLMLMLMLIP